MALGEALTNLGMARVTALADVKASGGEREGHCLPALPACPATV